MLIGNSDISKDAFGKSRESGLTEMSPSLISRTPPPRPPSRHFTDEEWRSINDFISHDSQESLEEKFKRKEERETAEIIYLKLRGKTIQYIKLGFEPKKAYMDFILNLTKSYKSEKDPEMKQTYLLDLIQNYENLLHLPAMQLGEG